MATEKKNKKLPLMIASSIRSLANSAKPTLVKIKEEEQKIAVIQQGIEKMKEALSDTDALIRKQLADYGGYGLNDLFKLQVKESTDSNGRTTRTNQMVWIYKETLLPPSESDEAEQAEGPTTQTEEEQTEQTAQETEDVF